MVFLLTIFLLPVFIILIFIPYWTRRTESFGVSIPEEVYHRNDLKEMRKKYAIQTSILSVLTVALFLLSYFFISQDENTVSIVYSVLVILFIIASFFIYLVFHRQMKEKKSTENWRKQKSAKTVVYTKFREQKLVISNWWYVVPIIITFITIGLTFYFYDLIPDEVALHYDASGKVTRWGEKSYGNVLLLPLIQLSLIIMFLIINIIIAKAKQQVNAQNPKESMQQNIIFRRRWSVFMYVMTLLLTTMFIFMHVNSYFVQTNQTLMVTVPIIVALVTVGGAIVLSITTGQGGSRVAIQSDKEEAVIDRDDDEHWKLGQFYFNKDDPTLFIEKRFGIGWTMNFGRPLAWLTIIGLIVLPLLIPLAILLL